MLAVRPIEVSRSVFGKDDQTRSTFTMEAFQTREKSTSLNSVFAYWQLLKPEDGVPTEDQFQPKRDLPASVGEIVSWVDVRLENPMQYVFWDHMSSERSKFGQEISGKTLGELNELGLGLHIISCAVEYAACKRFAQPSYHEIDQFIAGKRRHYTRLLLPVSNENGAVVKLYCAYRLIKQIP